MTYKFEFLPSALKEWEKLGHTVREQNKKRLRERLEARKMEADALRDCLDTTRSSCAQLAIDWFFELKMSGWLCWWGAWASASAGPFNNQPRNVS